LKRKIDRSLTRSKRWKQETNFKERIMIAFKATKKRSISACLPAAALLLLAHTAYGQIRIGGITVPKPNRANPTKAENQPQPENTERPSDARTEPAARSESSATAAVQQDPPAMYPSQKNFRATSRVLPLSNFITQLLRNC